MCCPGACRRRAERTYKAVLDRYPMNSKVGRPMRSPRPRREQRGGCLVHQARARVASRRAGQPTGGRGASAARRPGCWPTGRLAALQPLLPLSAQPHAPPHLPAAPPRRSADTAGAPAARALLRGRALRPMGRREEPRVRGRAHEMGAGWDPGGGGAWRGAGVCRRVEVPFCARGERSRHYGHCGPRRQLLNAMASCPLLRTTPLPSAPRHPALGARGGPVLSQR